MEGRRGRPPPITLSILDQKNVIVGLKAKGPAKKDKSGFVLDTNELNFLKVAA